MKTHYCNVSLPVFILFLLISINSPLLGQFAGGSGTEEDPYLISTATHLANLAENVNADTNYSGVYFKLMSDIDLNISPYNENEGWEPIGNSTYPFQGNFNGNGYTINGLFINRSSDDQGLFGFIKDAVIKNLGLQYVDVTGNVSVGGLVGRVDGSTITYCYSSGNVAGTNNVGGFIGIATSAFPSYNVISNCYSRGTVSRISGTAVGIAGFCGRSANRSKIIRSYSTSRVEWQDEPHPTDKGFVGITYGYFDDSEIIGSFWDIETSGQTRSAGEFDTSATGKKTAEMQAFGTFANAGWEFKIESITDEAYIWNIGNNRNDGYPYFDWQYPDDPPLIPVFAGGDGTENNPYQIANHEHLNNVRYFLNDTTVHFILMSDIDLTGKFDEEGVYNYGNRGWIPIGHSLNRFRGVFNGNGYAITGLTINRSYAFQGLFGSMRNAEIANLVLEDIEIIGGRHSGGLAGEVYESSLISNRLSAGMVVGDWSAGGLAGSLVSSTVIACGSSGEVSGRQNVGGLLGEASWAVIKKSSNSGSVNALQNSAGGILGRAYQSEISTSYSTGEVSGGGNDVGGLVGIMGQSTHINNCYSTGNVSGQSRVGGMVGYAFTNSTINNSYSSGTVTASVGTAGGLLGSELNSPANNSYWNIETSGQTTSAGGEGRTTDDMTYPYAENTYIDWNFTEIWAADVDGVENNGYPYLQIQSQPVEETYILFLAANPEDGGTVAGGGSYGEGNTVHVTASPAEGYAFINWTIDDEIVVDGDSTAGMVFEYIMPAMNITMIANFAVSPADIPALVSPVDGTNHISVDTILVWNEANGADTYQVQLSTDPDFITVKVDTSEIAATSLEVNGLESLTTYYWRVCAYNESGMSDWSAVWSFTTYDVTSMVSFEGEIPNQFMLSQNYPNPFNPSTVIRYGLPERTFVNLNVYNSLGQNVATLIHEELNAGFFEVAFDASHLPSGIYIYRLQAGEYVKSKRMLYLK